MIDRSPNLFTEQIRRRLQVEVVREYEFSTWRRWRFDYAIPSYRIAIEVEGGLFHPNGRHIRPEGFRRDMEKYNEAAILGWTLLRVEPNALLSEYTIGMIRRVMMNKKPT